MGLFDTLSEDPKEQAMLALYAGLLGNKGSFGQVAGQSMMGAMETLNMAKKRQMEAAAHQQEALLRKLQLQEYERKAKLEEDRPRRLQEAIASFPKAGVVAGPPTAEGAYPMRNPTEQDYMGWAMNSYAIDPNIAKFGFDAAGGVASREDKQQEARERQAAQLKAMLDKAEADRVAKKERQDAELKAEERMARLTASLKPPRPEPAPALTTIVDPADPTKMITVDARVWNPITRAGLLGTAGKEPAAMLRETKIATGQQQASEIIDNMRAAYNELDRMKAIPSNQRGAIENLKAGVAATSVGQTAGRLAGTKEQTERDVIASARLQLLNAIKQSTGMSAQQLNSNMELKSWLDAVTNPGQSKEAADRILDNIEKFIQTGGKYSERKQSGSVSNLSPAEQAELEALRKRFGK